VDLVKMIEVIEEMNGGQGNFKIDMEIGIAYMHTS
jgi:hypothetical protein